MDLLEPGPAIRAAEACFRHQQRDERLDMGPPEFLVPFQLLGWPPRASRNPKMPPYSLSQENSRMRRRESAARFASARSPGVSAASMRNHIPSSPWPGLMQPSLERVGVAPVGCIRSRTRDPISRSMKSVSMSFIQRCRVRVELGRREQPFQFVRDVEEHHREREGVERACARVDLGVDTLWGVLPPDHVPECAECDVLCFFIAGSECVLAERDRSKALAEDVVRLNQRSAVAVRVQKYKFPSPSLPCARRNSAP